MYRQGIAAMLLTLVPIYVFAAINLEARSDIERWSAGFGESNNGFWGSIGAQVSKGPWFGGTGFGSSLGGYKLANTPDSIITRREFDLLAGYQLTSKWSSFAGYRLFRVEYDSRDSSRMFIDNIHGFGGGASYGVGLRPKLAGFASAQVSALLAAVDYQNDMPVDRGWGLSLGSEFGLAYRLSSALNAVASLKYHTMNIDYGGARWNNSYTRLGARFNYRF